MSDQVKRWLDDVRARAGLGEVSPQVLVVALVVMALAVGWSLWRWWPSSVDASQEVAFSTEADAVGTRGETPDAGADKAATTDTTIVVHVAGQVRSPGVYHLEGGARVVDAVMAAGNAIGDAAVDSLNLARPLADGEQIYVPAKEEVVQGVSGGSVSSASSGSAQTASGAGSAGALVNINSADVATLETLPGVGPVTAQKIVAEREANGPFATPDDLSRVAGIGPKRLEQLRDVVSVN